MNSNSLHEGDPPGQIIRIAPVEPRDSRGRTLDQALHEDQLERAAEWERKLYQAYRPFAWFDWVLIAPPLFAVPLIAIGSLIGFVTQDDDWIIFSFRAAIVQFVLFTAYLPFRMTLLHRWMRRRLDRVKAAAAAEGVALGIDPLDESDQQWAGAEA